MMQEEPAKEEVKVEAKADAAPAKEEAAPATAAPTAAEGKEAANAAAGKEAVPAEEKKEAKVEAKAGAKKPLDPLTVDNSIPNGGYEGMVGGRSKFRDATIDEVKGKWSNLNYGPYIKTTGAPDRWEKALGRPDDKNFLPPKYGDAGGQNKFTN